MTMKKLTTIFIVLSALLFSANAFAQPGYWSSINKHKVLLGGKSQLYMVDTCKISGQSLTSVAGADPIWKSAEIPVVLTADTLTTGQTLVGTPLQFNAADTQSYYWFRIGIIDTSSSAAGIKIGFSIPSGASIKAQCSGETTGATASAWDLISAGGTAGVAYQTQNATGGMIWITGIVKTGSTAGAVIAQLLKVTSGTGGFLAKSILFWGKV